MRPLSKCGLAVVLVGFVGCVASTTPAKPDGGGTDASADGASGDINKACADQAAAACALRDMCAPNYGIAVVYGSMAACQTRTAQACVNALRASGTSNDAAKVEACAAALPSESCTDFYDGNPVAACVPTAGSVANGAACGANGQCTSTYCALAPHQICGTCAPLPAAGASCQTDDECGRGLACATPTAPSDGGAPTSGTCAQRVADGGSCLPGTLPCEAGDTCVGSNEKTMTQGTCKPVGKTVGAACDGSRQTMASCDADMGLACIPTAKGSAIGTCQNVTLVGTGATCGALGSAPITGFAVCQAGGLCQNGTCLAPAADGAACDSNPTVGPVCLAPARCVPSGSGTAGTCQMPNSMTCQ